MSEDTDFASVLTEQTFGQSVARGIRKPPQSEKSPDLKQDLLEDDFATISYEHALRTHARSTPAWSQHPANLFDSYCSSTAQAVN